MNASTLADQRTKLAERLRARLRARVCRAFVAFGFDVEAHAAAIDAKTSLEVARLLAAVDALVRLKGERDAVIARERTAEEWPIRVLATSPAKGPPYKYVAADVVGDDVDVSLAGFHPAPSEHDQDATPDMYRLPVTEGVFLDGGGTTERPIPGFWPSDVSADEVAGALDAVRGYLADVAREVAAALREDWIDAASEVLPYVDHYQQSPLAPSRVAFVLSVLKQVHAERAPKITLDAGRPNQALVAGLGRAAARGRHQELEEPTRLRIRFPDDDPLLQLELPFDIEESFSEGLTRRIGKWRSAFGMRNWIALQRLLSVEGGRTGRVIWRLDAHLDALGMGDSWRLRPENRARVIELIRLMTKIRFEYGTGEARAHGPILAALTEFDLRQHGVWETQAIELHIHSALYAGIRRVDGTLGGKYWPVPAELATVDHEKFAPAVLLGPILAIRFRWDVDGQDVVSTYSVAKLLEMGGIKVHNGEFARALATLARNLAELGRVGVINPAIEWDEPRSLRSMVRLRPSDASMDQAIRHLPPLEPALHELEKLPRTGVDLVKWREARDMTQLQLAAVLGHSVATERRLERDPRPLTPSELAALRRYLAR